MVKPLRVIPSRDCGLYVIVNIRNIDQCLPLRMVNSLEARIRVLSEVKGYRGKEMQGTGVIDGRAKGKHQQDTYIDVIGAGS